MKYLKTYAGHVSGSMGGYNDGYPETKLQVFHNLRDLTKVHGTRQNEKYYELTAIEDEALAEFCGRIRDDIRDQAVAEKEEKIKDRKAEIKKLQKELELL